MYLISFLTPKTHLEIVKNAMFVAGAGKIGNYSNCAWQTLGEGQFMPTSGSNAFIGEINKLEIVPEYKVELVCNDTIITEVIAALKAAHPYETPAYHVLKLIDI